MRERHTTAMMIAAGAGTFQILQEFLPTEQAKQLHHLIGSQIEKNFVSLLRGEDIGTPGNPLVLTGNNEYALGFNDGVLALIKYAEPDPVHGDEAQYPEAKGYVE